MTSTDYARMAEDSYSWCEYLEKRVGSLSVLLTDIVRRLELVEALGRAAELAARLDDMQRRLELIETLESRLGPRQ